MPCHAKVSTSRFDTVFIEIPEGASTRTQQYEVLCECRDRVRATSRLGRRRRLLRARRDARMTTTTAAARAAWASLAMQFIASTFWAVGAGLAGLAAMLQIAIPIVSFVIIHWGLPYRFGRFSGMQSGRLQ